MVFRNLLEDRLDHNTTLLPKLLEIQSKFGYCPQEQLEDLARELKIPKIKVYEAATFYKFLSTKKGAKHTIYVCHSLSCYLNNSENLMELLEKKLGIKRGEKTHDSTYFLDYTSCIGCCDNPPAALVDEIPYYDLTKEKMDEIVGICN